MPGPKYVKDFSGPYIEAFLSDLVLCTFYCNISWPSQMGRGPSSLHTLDMVLLDVL
jgi:hypothetical protein